MSAGFFIGLLALANSQEKGLYTHMVETLLQGLTANASAAVSIIGALTAIITVIQGRRQARQDQEQRKKDEEQWDKEHELHGRQTKAAEQNNEEIHGLVLQLAENNDPAKREQLEKILEEKLGKSPMVTPEVLNAQLSTTRATLRAEMRDLRKHLDNVVTAHDLVQHVTMFREMVQKAEALNQKTETLEEQVEHQAEQGLNMNIEQLQRELLLSIGNELIQLAERVAPPTVRRTPPLEPPTIQMWGEG